MISKQDKEVLKVYQKNIVEKHFGEKRTLKSLISENTLTGVRRKVSLKIPVNTVIWTDCITTKQTYYVSDEIEEITFLIREPKFLGNGNYELSKKVIELTFRFSKSKEKMKDSLLKTKEELDDEVSLLVYEKDSVLSLIKDFCKKSSEGRLPFVYSVKRLFDQNAANYVGKIENIKLLNLDGNLLSLDYSIIR